jgi:uncharacterized membrane protein YccC
VVSARSTTAEVIRRIATEAIAFDPGGVAVGQGLRVAAGTVTALAVGWVGWSYPVGAAAAGGALAMGPPSIVPGGRPRLGVLAVAAVGMGLGAFVGSATAPVDWLYVLVSGGWAAAAGVIAAVDAGLTPVGINSLMALVVFGRFPASPGDALRTGVVVGAGALLQVALAGVRRGHHVPRELEALAAAYRALGGYAGAVARGASSLDASAAVDGAAAAIARSRVDAPAPEAWHSLVDEADRIRLELLSLAGERERLARVGTPDELLARLTAALDEVGRLLAAVATSLAAGRPTAAVDDLCVGVERLSTLLPEDPPGAPRTAGSPAGRAALTALAGQLRAVAGQLPAALGSPPGRVRRDALSRVAVDGLTAVRTLLRRVRATATWEGSAVRHALRLAAVVVLAELIGRVTGVARPYWIALTGAIILRPDFATTFTRGVGRAVGTLAGVAVASVVAITLPPRHVAIVALVGLFEWAGAALFRASFALFSAGVTGAVVFLLAGVDTSPVADAVDRLLATVIGAALALGLYAAWPSWAREEAWTALADLVDAHRAYMAEVLCEVAGVRPRRRDTLDALDRQRRLARSNAEAAIARSLTDPPPRRIDGRLAAGMLAAIRRQVIAAHTLRTRLLEEGGPTVPELRPLAEALDATMAAASAALRGRRVQPPPPLRPLHDRLVAALRRRQLDPELRTLLETQTDEIVDAANTMTYRLWSGAAADQAVPGSGFSGAAAPPEGPSG